MERGLRTVRDLCLPAKGRKQIQEKMPFKAPEIYNGHMEKWLFLVLLYIEFLRLNAKSCALRSLRSLRA